MSDNVNLYCTPFVIVVGADNDFLIPVASCPSSIISISSTVKVLSLKYLSVPLKVISTVPSFAFRLDSLSTNSHTGFTKSITPTVSVIAELVLPYLSVIVFSSTNIVTTPLSGKLIICNSHSIPY